MALNDADQGVAAELAVNALRKHLPTAQRVFLGLVEPKRALALRPIGITADSLARYWGGLTSRLTRRCSAWPRVSAWPWTTRQASPL